MSYLEEIGRGVSAQSFGQVSPHSPRQVAPQASLAATPLSSISQLWRPSKNLKNDMNYEAIKARIKTLIEDARRKPKGRVEAALEPIRESLLEARREGVRVRDLYDVVKTEAKDISPGSFAKYAQRHLQVKKTKGKHRPTPPAAPPAKPTEKHENVKSKLPAQTPKPATAKPRIATGNY